MDDTWIAALSGLGGVVLGAGLGALRERAGRSADRTRETSRQLHESGERRFDARREAYASFAGACRRTMDETDAFGYEHQGALPGDVGHEGPHDKIWQALNGLRIIGPPELINLGEASVMALNEWAFCYGQANRAGVEHALTAFEESARKILGFDVS